MQPQIFPKVIVTEPKNPKSLFKTGWCLTTNEQNIKVEKVFSIMTRRKNLRPTKVRLPEISLSYEKRKPNIKKVLTKWKDEAKYEDLNFSSETSTSSERNHITSVNFAHTDDTSTESVNYKATLKKRQPSKYNNYRPNFQSQYSEETEVYSTNIQIVDSYTPRPTYLHTKRPSPTPIITNGQAKEACPDLNIAVNTNVINKNVVIESDEEETESLFPGGFGIPLGDDNDSTLDESSANDYFGGDSVENQEAESASVEESELLNYNAANAIQSESSEPGGLFSPSSPVSALSKPGRPSKDDDDIFSFSSLVQFFRPAISALGSTTIQSHAAEESKPQPTSSSSSTTAATPESSRDVKTKVPIRESIKLVANQLLDKPSENDSTVTTDIKVQTKVKTQAKHKIKTRNEDNEEAGNTHAGVAVPVSMEELETEVAVKENESSTSNEGISTWVLVSNPVSSNTTVSTEPSKMEEPKKQKPAQSKNKKKQPNKPAKRPVIGSTNKSDLIAGGSAINENVYNKIKDTVLSNVQKNKTPSTQRTTTVKSTTSTTPTEVLTTKKTETKAPVKATSNTSETMVTTKPKKKKNKNKVRSTTEEPFINDSALLPMEAKGPEIELEVSTPPVTTKKPKRSATRKKTKTKKRKTTKPKPDEASTSLAEIKTNNKTKSAKPGKKPQAQVAITSQLYNYLSREVMPSVGVGVLGLASIVGIASYFFYPFSTPVRRTFEVDKRDDLYKNNAEDYASEGNGQAEEEMLGTVLAGMPAHAKSKLNPYAGQTAYINSYPAKKLQPQPDLRYRHVAAKYEPNYNVRYPQQKTGLAHGAVYSKPVNYSPHYETRHAYTTEGKFNYDKLPTSYAPYQPATAAVEPIYAAPQTGPSSSEFSSHGNDASNSVVYSVKPSAESDFKPVYPFEGQFYNEATNSPVTYAPTSLFLGLNVEPEGSVDEYVETSSELNETDESKFVVGNVPKELSDTATPAVVPEHGPRKLNRRKRNTSVRRSISTSLEELLRSEKENNNFLSNEIDDSIVMPLRSLAAITENAPINQDLPTSSKPEEVYTVYAARADQTKAVDEEPMTIKNEVIESVSTVPINDNEEKITTESDSQTDVEVTTKTFRVYEVFSSPDVTSSPIFSEASPKAETTTPRSIMTETTTELRSETASFLPSTQSAFTDSKDPGSITLRPTPIITETVTYPPLNESPGFFSFLRRLVDFKIRLGLSILQNTSETLNRFLKSVETPPPSQIRFAKASQVLPNTKKNK
ncbi:Uncharacterized protein OBRU01_13010 [Operophtera brumata]|uniref:Uncharacterized protein n=1 Tax=Operophtera brumata TaxID=104452 RepID=A0A0L7L9F4_OPEBR|nr:Uncharacterized protein OBRU01_13010 [Operophtera brumata]